MPSLCATCRTTGATVDQVAWSSIGMIVPTEQRFSTSKTFPSRFEFVSSGQKSRKFFGFSPRRFRAVQTGDPITVFGQDYDTADGTCVPAAPSR